MKSDGIAIPNIPEIKTASPLSSPRDQAINTTSEDRASSSSSSSSSSPSDLRRRLQDLPSPNEFNLLADRVAALGRRICRKRELFLRLHGVASRIEENDEWEEKEQRAGSECSLAASRPKDARARRRARIRAESSPGRDDKAMVISQAGDRSAGGPPEVTDGVDKSNRAGFPTADRSPRDDDYFRLPAIEVSRRRPRPTSSVSVPSSARFPHRNSDGPRGIKTNAAFQSYRNFTPRDGASKSADLPSVSPFSLSNARPRKFGGYRPSSGVIVKNLSSGSESESANETNRRFSSVRKIDNSTATLELSSPESKVAVNEPTKEMPIMSARSDVTGSVLPNLLPSTRSIDSDDLDRRIFQDTPQSCVAERVNRDGSATKIYNELEEETRDASAKVICKRRANRDGPAMRVYNDFKRLESEFENKHDETERMESYRSVTKIQNDDTKDRFDFNCLTERSDLEADSSKTIDKNTLDTAKWDLLTSLRAKESINISHLMEKVKTDVAEDASSSRTSEQIESEEPSRSSCTAKVYSQKEVHSSGRSKNDADTSDKCGQEGTMATSVPTLALNSQDISYSTSADSRECSAMRPLDPHALIKALSSVSLKQQRQGGSVSRKREDFYRRDTTDAPSVPSNFPTRGETWRVPRTSESPGRSLSRVPSRIPVRISSSKIVSPIGAASKLSGGRGRTENSDAVANRAEAKFIDQSAKREAAEYGAGEADREPGGAILSNRRSSRSTPYGDRTRDKTRRLSESGFSGESCPPVFFGKAAHPGDRDYARIDDDVRSRSNCTSRKSAETADVTSATESPKYKRGSNPRRESSRDAEENVTWRTEDECPSINDEENPEDAEDQLRYGSFGNEPDELYSQMKECFELAGEGMRDSEIQSFRLGSSAEMEKVAGKRRVSDESEFENEESSFDRSLESAKIARSEVASFVARMSPSNLNCESKRKKRSQERFPFTISEASGALSTEHKDTSDYQLPDEDFRRAKLDEQLEEKTVPQLKLHPSITRLATSGMDDTVADILCSVAQEQKDNEMPSKSRMRAFMRIFSSKLRKAPKRSSDSKSLEPAKVIYENRACQVDSRANSCSGDSLAEEARRINSDKFSNDHWIDVTRSNPVFVSSGNLLKKTESRETIAREHPRRRHDRDDLWVQDVKDPSFDEKEDRDEKDNLKADLPKDRYSIFLAKNFQPDNLSESNLDDANSPRERRDLISGHVALSDGKSKQSIDQKLSSTFVREEVEEMEEDLTGCSCWRLCHITAPPKNRSSIRERVPSSSRTKGNDSPLRKRKK